jgi:predicted nucleotidyltransferase
MKKDEVREKALREFVKKVKDKYGDKVEKIILFGSYAQGNYDEESDVDVLVVGDATLEGLLDISYPILLESGVYISPKAKKGKSSANKENILSLKALWRKASPYERGRRSSLSCER